MPDVGFGLTGERPHFPAICAVGMTLHRCGRGWNAGARWKLARIGKAP